MAKTKVKGKGPKLPVKHIVKAGAEWKPGGGVRTIQIKAFVGKKVKRHIERVFNTVPEAAAYIEEIIGDRKPEYTKDHTYALIGSMDNILCNMPIDMVLNKEPIPKEGLQNIVTTASVVIPGVKERIPGIDAPTPSKEAKSSSQAAPRRSAGAENSSGGLVHLKQISNDPRKARQILRKAVKDQKRYPALYEDHRKNARWAWPEGSQALAEAKAALFGGEKK